MSQGRLQTAYCPPHDHVADNEEHHHHNYQHHHHQQHNHDNDHHIQDHNHHDASVGRPRFPGPRVYGSCVDLLTLVQ